MSRVVGEVAMVAEAIILLRMYNLELLCKKTG